MTPEEYVRYCVEHGMSLSDVIAQILDEWEEHFEEIARVERDEVNSIKERLNRPVQYFPPPAPVTQPSVPKATDPSDDIPF